MTHLDYCKTRLAALASRTSTFNVKLGAPYCLYIRPPFPKATIGFMLGSPILEEMYKEVVLNINTAIQDMQRLDRPDGPRYPLSEELDEGGHWSHDSHLQHFQYQVSRVALTRFYSDAHAATLLKRLETKYPNGAGVFRFTGFSIDFAPSASKEETFPDRTIDFPFRQSV